MGDVPVLSRGKELGADPDVLPVGGGIPLQRKGLSVVPATPLKLGTGTSAGTIIHVVVPEIGIIGHIENHIVSVGLAGIVHAAGVAIMILVVHAAIHQIVYTDQAINELEAHIRIKSKDMNILVVIMRVMAVTAVPRVHQIDRPYILMTTPGFQL